MVADFLGPSPPGCVRTDEACTGIVSRSSVRTKGVSSADERHGLCVVHAHSPENFADLRGAQRRVWYPIGPWGFTDSTRKLTKQECKGGVTKGIESDASQLGLCLMKCRSQAKGRARWKEGMS